MILRMQKLILGMASHHLCNAKPTILGATPGAIPGIDGNANMTLIFFFAHAFSGFFFFSIRARARNKKATIRAPTVP